MSPQGYGELLKPPPTDCVCGCGLVGQPRKKVWKDGTSHVARCQCRRCKGGRHGANERVRNNRIAKRTGGQREPGSGQLSGIDGRSGFWEWEETSNVTLVRGFRSWIGSKQIEAKLSRLMKRTGARRVFILTWDGKPRWCVMPYADWENVAAEDQEDAS
jgi:hypothetical protein